MSDPVFGDEKVQYPVEVHFRVVCHATPDVMERLQSALLAIGIDKRLTTGNASASGKYQSYELSLVVDSEPQMKQIDATLRGVDGVKMVL